MDDVARLAPTDRSDLFRAVAEIKGVSVQVIEKDFWVCWVLRHLFTLDDLGADLFFKGGTSLSKVHKVIDRMSEDIDLVIDREGLGFTGEKDPQRQDLSGKARKRLISELKTQAADFVANRVFAALLERFELELGEPAEGSWTLQADVSNLDNTAINFHYPSNEEKPEFLRPMVLLELGARGDTWPAIQGEVTPYAAEALPGQFSAPTATVPTISAERTFWEKATLLHTLAHRDPDKAIGNAIARHYYDVYRLIQSDHGKAAIQDLKLLEQVVEHKSTFYPGNSYRYDLAVPGSLRLVPDESMITKLRPQYDETADVMVFGDAPSFDEVLKTLTKIEQELREHTEQP